MTSEVRTGLDRLADGEVRIEGRRIALLTNRAARTSDGVTALDVALNALPLDLLLGPEHGLAGTAAAGEAVDHSTWDDIPVLSLYGADLAPVEAALTEIDMLVVDLQDVGCRYYTFPWTVTEVLRLAARLGFAVYILDRPTPLGRSIESPLPQRTDSPVCAVRAPIRHGLTLGEIARLQARDLDLPVDLRVIPVTGWQPNDLWPATGLPWVPPSPNLRTFEAALAYPGTCLLEGTNVSEGRGTEAPFLLAGAPFVDADDLAARLSEEPALGTGDLTPISFVPVASKWRDETCWGVRITPAPTTRPVALGVALIAALRAYPDFRFRPSHFDALAGGPALRAALQAGRTSGEITEAWSGEERLFASSRADALLYPAAQAGRRPW